MSDAALVQDVGIRDGNGPDDPSRSVAGDAAVKHTELPVGEGGTIPTWIVTPGNSNGDWWGNTPLVAEYDANGNFVGVVWSCKDVK